MSQHHERHVMVPAIPASSFVVIQSEFFEGHPLALRLFASSIPIEVAGDPTRLFEMIFDEKHLTSADPLQSKILRLLSFYDRMLDSGRRQALELLALFRLPVEEKILLTLWTSLLRGKDSIYETPLIVSETITYWRKCQV